MKRFVLFFITAALVLPGVVPAALARVPDDTFYGQQWYLKHIQMEEAWDTTIGSSEVVVAVIDTGVDIYHEDLSDNIWTNDREIIGNGKDDDANGFIDDIHGWNFVANSNDVRPWGNAASDDAFVHGTLVASIIGAKGNNGRGIAGIAWNVKIMPLVALNDEGSGTTVDVANAIYYAVQNGADIINLSVEGNVRDIYFDEALAYARSRGVLTVTAAGNSGMIGGANLNIMPVYPACSSIEGIFGVVTVGGTDQFDKKAVFANYGRCIDVSAPSEDIFAARPLKRGADGKIIAAGYEGGYSGTSLSVSLISGIAALLKSRHPQWGATELRNRIMAGTTPIDDLNDERYAGGLGSGRIDAALAVDDAYFIDQGKRPLELEATNPGVQTRIRILSETDTIEVAPFDADDTRGARTAFVDINEDGTPEIAVVPASGDIAEWTLLGRDGQIQSRGELSGELADGALVAGIDRGFVIADEGGGRAWGVGTDLTAHPFYPYESRYDLGLDLLEIDGAAAFAPRMSGGRLVITDVTGHQIVSAFPFGTDTRGRWSLAKMERDDTTHLVFSGTSGTKSLDSKHLGQVGWEDVSFAELESAVITLSSGRMTERTPYRLYDSWPK